MAHTLNHVTLPGGPVAHALVMEDVLPKYQAAFTAAPGVPIRAQSIGQFMYMAACASVIGAVSSGVSVQPIQFAWLLALTATASCLHVRIPGLKTTVSAGSFLIPLAITQTSAFESLLIAAASAVAQGISQRDTARDRFLVSLLITRHITAAFIAHSIHAAVLQTFAGIEPAVAMAVIAAVYFPSATLPDAAAIAWSQGKSVVHVWRSCYLWAFPYHLVAASMLAHLTILWKMAAWQTLTLVLLVLCLVVRLYRSNFRQLEADKGHAEELAHLHLRTVEALALAIEAKDHTTNAHLQRVRIYASEIGRELNLDATQLRALEAAALLHDIGKLAIPEHIISKPGRLTAEEFEKMKTHPIVGAEILECVQFPYPVAPIVRAHHERWDGTGYPAGLSGQQIPIGARILAAVDCLDALASDRQYRRAIPLNEAMRLVRAQSGAAFDPAVVSVLDARYVELEQLARAHHSGRAKLSTDVPVAPGVGPASGFAEPDDLPNANSGKPAGDFISSIAAARHEVHMLFEMSQSLGTSLSLTDTLSMLAKRLQKIVPHDTLAIYLKRGDRLTVDYTTGVDAEIFRTLSVSIGQGISGWVMENCKPVVNGNPAVEPGYISDSNPFTTLRSALSVPLESMSGPIGVLTLYHTGREFFTNDHIRILLAISSKLALSIENSLRYRQAEDNATIDYLTGLPNGRSLFLHVEQEIARCKRSGAAMAVLVCDLDGFKQVNDRFGHLEGNRILTKVAGVLRQSCRGGDYVARMGGDEFVIVMPDVQQGDVQRFAERTRQAICRIGVEDYDEPLLNASIGCAELTDEVTQAEQLLSHADRLMYAVKRQHKESQPAAGLVSSPPNQSDRVLVQ